MNLLGTWELDHVLELAADGHVLGEPYGPDPIGYNEEGFMSPCWAQGIARLRRRPVQPRQLPTLTGSGDTRSLPTPGGGSRWKTWSTTTSP